METILTRDVLRSITMGIGEQFVMTVGQTLMLLLYAECFTNLRKEYSINGCIGGWVWVFVRSIPSMVVLGGGNGTIPSMVVLGSKDHSSNDCIGGGSYKLLCCSHMQNAPQSFVRTIPLMIVLGVGVGLTNSDAAVICRMLHKPS